MMLDTRSAAERIGGTSFSPRTLNNWRSLGVGPPFHKIGARVLYDASDLDAWLATRKRTSTSQTAAA